MRLFLPLLLVPLFLAAAAAPAAAQDVLVVTPKAYGAVLGAWKAHREGQGLGVVVREPGSDVAAVVREVHAKSAGKLRFVLLLGDVEQVPCAQAPPHMIAGFTGFGPEDRIPSDAPWGDLDGDGIPELCVGRVPADAPEEARDYLARVVAYEGDRDVGPWRRRLNVVAGVGNFGLWADMALENLTKRLLTRNVPPAVDVTATYAHPLSPWCPPPAEFADHAVRRFSEGALAVAYIGHGSAHTVDRVRYGTNEYPILEAEQVAKIASEHGAPLAAFVACSTGHLDGPRDCLAEDLLRRPRGPIAVIASSRISTPYANGIVAKELLDALYMIEEPTAGELLRTVRRRLVSAAAGDAARVEIERMAAGFYERSEERRAQDRADHVLLYNLFGDPCVRIARPARAEVTAPAEVAPGGRLRVSGTSPVDGTALVELATRRDAPVALPPAGKRTPEDFRKVYEAANSHVVASAEAPVQGGAFEAELAVPADLAPGTCHVRVYVTGPAGAAASGREVAVR